MNISQLSNSKLLITLADKDMKDFNLSFDTMTISREHERKIVMRLLQAACLKSGVSIKDKTVLIEALPHVGGCALFVTLMDKSDSRKVYKVKKLKKIPGVRFENAEALLCACESLKRSGERIHKNSLWLYENEYYLIMDYPLMSKSVGSVISQFGRLLSLTSVAVSRIKEGGKLLCSESALESIGEWLRL